MVVVPETHSDVFDGTKLIVQTLNSIGLGRGEGKEWEGQYNLALLQFDGQSLENHDREIERMKSSEASTTLHVLCTPVHVCVYVQLQTTGTCTTNTWYTEYQVEGNNTKQKI